MRPERQRLHIDPYYCPPLTNAYDLNSPQSSPSPSYSFSPLTGISPILSRTTMSAAPEWRLCSVLCLYDFTSSDPDHLPFRKNEILDIVEKEESGWWAALRDDRIGWVPNAFVAELTNEAAENLRNVTEELRVCEYEAEKLFSTGPVTGTYRFVDSTFSPVSARGNGYGSLEDASWVPIMESSGKASFVQTMSPSVHVVTDFPDDVGPLSGISPPHPHSRIDTYSIDAEMGSTPSKSSLAPSLGYPPSPTSHIQHPSRPTISSLHINKPTPPTPPPPLVPTPTSAVPPRSPLNRSRSDSAPSLQSRSTRRRPIMVNDFKSLSRLSVFLDSPHPDAAADDELQTAFEEVRPALVSRRSDKVRQLTGDEDAQAFHNAKVAQASLPWYLQPSYSPDEIKLEYDGSVRAGTLPALVERLTVDPLKMTQEKMFRDVCLATFKTFTTATEFFQLLVERYEMDYPSSLTREESTEWREKKLRPVQKRVLAILTMWVENHGLIQDDPHMVLRLREFLSMIASPPSLALSAKLLFQTIEKLTSTVQSPCQALSTPSSKRRKPPRSPKSDLARIDPIDLATQLMLYEYRLYMKVRPRECLLWAKTQVGESVANLIAFCATHDRVAAWVKSSVLMNDGLGKRAETVDYWIKVAEKCRTLNNFSSMSAIVAALSSADLTRLHLTWVHVGRNHQLEALLRLNDPYGNFSAYRAALQTVEGPCIPFVGIFLTDIVHIQDQLKDNISFPLSHRAYSSGQSMSPPPLESAGVKTFSETGYFATSPATISSYQPSTPANAGGPPQLGSPLINFVKRQKWYDAVRAIVRFQGKAPNVVENAGTMAVVIEQLAFGAAKLKEPSPFWARSQELQQSEVSHADIRKGLEAAGF